MDLEQAIVHELSSITTLNGKVFPQKAGENVNPPFVLYISSEGEKVQTLGGYVDSKEVNVTFHVVSQTYEELRGLMKQVVDKVASFFGRAIGIDGPVVQSFEYTEPTEEFNEELDYHSSTFDVKVHL
jgi:thioredoxin-related protein